MERRTLYRAQTNINAICRVPASPASVTVRDLSATGCCVSLAGRARAPTIGTSIQVNLAPGIASNGMVIWSAGSHAGVRFDTRLTTKQAIELGIQAGPAVPIAATQVTLPENGGLQHWVRKAIGFHIDRPKAN